VVGAYTEFVRVTVTHVNRRLADVHGCEPIRWYVTINEPNILVLNTYLGHQFPSGADPGRDAVLRAYNRLLSAHVRAYNAVHDLHRAEGWPAPRVSLNTYCSDLYWSDKFLWDLLCVRRRRIKPARLRDYVYRRSQKMDRALLAARLPFQHDLPYLIGRVVHFVADHLGYRAFDRKHFAFYLKELFASPRADVFDFVGLDYYDPFTAHAIRLPTFADLEFETRSLRTWLMEGVTRKWWDWRSLPEGLHFFCKYYSEDLRRPVLIAENGMAHRRKPDNSFAGPRGDLLTRSAHLELHVKQVCRLVQEGVPLLGYLHWSLMDNYEWGSFTPRFGLFTIDYAKGTDRLAQDHVGDRPSETYARLVREACGLPAVPAPRS
jgi:beta-glucosidase/6-phospho-beta-glucosidase/beta-galactosidase